MKRLYDVRSKAVHGSKLTDQALEEHLREARRVLGRLICACLDSGKVWTEADLDGLLLA